MGIEFTIVKELATISATLAEVAAIDRLIRDEIGSGEFLTDYNSLISDISNSYRTVINTLQPLSTITRMNQFQTDYATVQQTYASTYQKALSEPRINAEFTFEKYLQFRKRKELTTSYPPLKMAFSRLHDFIDKWIDNDIWLAMRIDTLLKMLFRFTNEVVPVKSKDPEMGFAIFQSCIEQLTPFLQIMASHLQQIQSRLKVAA